MRKRGGRVPRSPLATCMVLLVALLPRENLDKGHTASVHLGTLKGGRAIPQEMIQGSYGPKSTKLLHRGLCPMGITRPHRPLMNQGPHRPLMNQGPTRS